jgi:hypothetical protein
MIDFLKLEVINPITFLYVPIAIQRTFVDVTFAVLIATTDELTDITAA